MSKGNGRMESIKGHKRVHWQKALTTNWPFPSASTSIISQAADLQHTLKGVQGGDQERSSLCPGKNWHSRPSDSQIFSGEDFMSPVIASPQIYKSTKIFHGDTATCDQQQLSAKTCT